MCDFDKPITSKLTSLYRDGKDTSARCHRASGRLVGCTACALGTSFAPYTTIYCINMMSASLLLLLFSVCHHIFTITSVPFNHYDLLFGKNVSRLVNVPSLLPNLSNTPSQIKQTLNLESYTHIIYTNSSCRSLSRLTNHYYYCHQIIVMQDEMFGRDW